MTDQPTPEPATDTGKVETINVYELYTVGSYDTMDQARDAVRRHWRTEHGSAQLPGFVIDDGHPRFFVWELAQLDGGGGTDG